MPVGVLAVVVVAQATRLRGFGGFNGQNINFDFGDGGSVIFLGIFWRCAVASKGHGVT